MIHGRSLGIRFEGVGWIFREISFQLPPGGSWAIVGPSGSGKTLLLKLIARLIRPTEGELQVASRNIGMLFQKNALFDSFTVEENLLFTLKERKGLIGAVARSKCDSWLEAVGLQQTQKLYPEELSGGMQKRLGIARALIADPELILYDEPTAGLDPITSKKIAELMVRLRRESGATLVVVTNDIHRAYQLGDRIDLLARGQLLSGGTPEEVRRTTDPAFRQFIDGLSQGPLTEQRR